MFDAVIIGGGMAGMATAARIQAAGLSTIVLEAHGLPGGCAGYFRRRGFSFDVGATTLVDFEPGGVGHELLKTIGMTSLELDTLPGYIAWLPDRTITLHRDATRWHHERLATLGQSSKHRQLWRVLDKLADTFWHASRRGICLPLSSFADVVQTYRSIRFQNLPLSAFLFWRMGDLLRVLGLRHDKPLVALLGMLIEDTVHSTVDEAPLINAALGITIRGAGLSRAKGGMRGFWEAFAHHYEMLGGTLRVGCRVERVHGTYGDFTVRTNRGDFQARQVISALPVELTVRIAPSLVMGQLSSYIERDRDSQGGAIVVFLGVPEEEVAGQEFTHHQLIQHYDDPLGYGNNMFISVSAPGDTWSAPPGHRAVMISTHCDLASWEGLDEDAYQARKCDIGERLVSCARRVYPCLGERAVVYQVGTPRTYARYTRRPRGAVGGVKQTRANSNQNAVPHDIGVRGFWLTGDTTWPGLGTVACAISSRIAAQYTLQYA